MLSAVGGAAWYTGEVVLDAVSWNLRGWWLRHVTAGISCPFRQYRNFHAPALRCFVCGHGDSPGNVNLIRPAGKSM